MTAPLTGIVREVAEEALSLALILGEAEAVQWSPSYTSKPREDTVERSSGEHADPTLATVVDEKRLAVRANVEASYRALRDAVQTLQKCRRSIERALDAWQGEPDAPTR